MAYTKQRFPTCDDDDCPECGCDSEDECIKFCECQYCSCGAK